jgi:uncharacterized membrane protein YhhN
MARDGSHVDPAFSRRWGEGVSLALGILVGLSFALYLHAIYLGPVWQVYLFKPLTTILILAGAVVTARRQRSGKDDPRYGRLICLGLLCSLAGDVLLMLPRDRFVAGLGAFLLAHVCYIGAFSSPGDLRATWRVGIPYVLLLAVLLLLLLPRVGGLRAPAAVYGTALVGMAWQAAERWHAMRGSGPAGAATGGALFIASDAALAVDRFVAPFHAASLVIMGTYVVAQWLIAASVGRVGPGLRSRREYDGTIPSTRVR